MEIFPGLSIKKGGKKIFIEIKLNKNKKLMMKRVNELIRIINMDFKKRVLIHGAAVVMDRGGIIFLGKSGAGKTTIANIFSKRFLVLSDDRVVVQEDCQGMYLSTWMEDTINRIPLKAMMILKKSKENRIEKASLKEAIQEFFKRSLKPLWDAEEISQVYEFSKKVAKSVPCYKLYFRKDDTVIKFLQDAKI